MRSVMLVIHITKIMLHAQLSISYVVVNVILKSLVRYAFQRCSYTISALYLQKISMCLFFPDAK